MHKQGSTQQPRRFAGLQGSSQDKDAAELYVLGLPATLFRDDDTAQAIEEERHLVPWQGDYTTLVDRFDGRNLLDDLRQLEQHAELQQGLQDADEADAELAHERYCDVDYSKEWQLGGGPPPGPLGTSAGGRPGSASESGSGGTSSGEGSTESDPGGSESEESDADLDAPLPPPPRPAQATPPAVYGAQPEDWEEGGESAGHGNYAAVGFQYDYPQVQEEQQGPAQAHEAASTQVAALPGPPYRPPFDVPSHLHVLPDSERVDKVIVETARFVRKGGGQVEVLLRVRQAGNPMFSFLQPGDPLHPYYTWIVKTVPKEIERPAPPAASEPTHTAGAPTHGPASPTGQLDRANSWLAGIQYSDADSEPSSPAAGLPSLDPASAGLPEPAPSSPVQFGPQLPPHLATGVQQLDAGCADAPAAGTDAAVGLEGSAGAGDGTPPPGRAMGPASPSSPLSAAADAAAAGSPGGVAAAAVEQGDGAMPLSGSLSPSPAPAAATAGTSSSEAPAAAAAETLPEGGVGANQQAEGSEQRAVGSALEGTAGPVAVVDGAAGASEADAQMLQVINKLVGFVKRSGAKFEATVRKREANNPAFSFLQPSDPHHHLYRAALAKALGSAAAADQLLATSQAYLAQPAGTATSQPAASLRPLPGSSAGTADAAGSSSTAGAAAPSPAASAAVTATAVAAEAKPLQVVAVVGPEKKPLVLKANPPLAAHQAMRVAAQQAAALIAKQAAAAKAGGAQEPAAAAEASVPVDPQQALQQAVLQATRVLQRTGPGAAAAAAGGTAASESTGQEAGPAAAAATPPAAVPGAVEPGAPGGDGAQAAAALEAVAAAAAAAAEDEEARAQKLLQRRLKARALLAQKLAERQKEEEAVRAHAVASHRQALLLGGDSDAPSSEAPLSNLPHHSTSSAGPQGALLAPLMGATPAAAAPGGLASRAELPPSVAVAMHRLVMRQAAAADEDLALLDELEELEEGELPAADLNPSSSPSPSLPAAASAQPDPGAQGTQLPAQGEPGASPADAAVAAVGSEPAAQPGPQQPAAEEPAAVLLQVTGEAGIQPLGRQPLQQQQQDEEMGPEAPEGEAADTRADLQASPETARAEAEPALPPGVPPPGASAAAPVSSGSSSSSGAATSTPSTSSASPSDEESSRKRSRHERHSSKDGRGHSPGRKHRSRDRQRGASPASPRRSSKSPHRSSKSRSRQHHDKESKHPRKHHRRHRRADDGSSGSEHERSSSRRRHRHRSSSGRQDRHKRSRSERDSGTDDSSDGGRSRRAHKRHHHDTDRHKDSRERGAGDSAKRHSSRGSAEEGSRARSAAGSKGSRGGTGTGPVVVVAVGDRITLQPASSLPSSSTTTSKPPLPPAAAAAAGRGGAAAGAGDLRSRLRSLLEQKFKL